MKQELVAVKQELSETKEQLVMIEKEKRDLEHLLSTQTAEAGMKVSRMEVANKNLRESCEMANAEILELKQRLDSVTCGEGQKNVCVSLCGVCVCLCVWRCI